jgi:hypothetical protein
MPRSTWFAGLLLLAIGVTAVPRGQSGDAPPWEAFLATASADRAQSAKALEAIAARWRPGYAGMVVDVARFLPSPVRRPPEDSMVALPDAVSDPAAPIRDQAPSPARLPPGAEARRRLTRLLEAKTGQRHGDDLRAWRRWIWSQPYDPHPGYAAFKSALYGQIDPGFRRFFPANVQATIRLDEIDWGGVGVNGIPPLRSPATIPAADAGWLRDDHVVFGIVIDGAARAYPRRILAWHELALDQLGGVDLSIVYCTLCGTVIPYDSRFGDRRFTFGTSGLLYRSNKLMFDEETGSLWSSLEGMPVVGPLVNQGLRLTFHPVVTTTWGEWKRDHPSTTVLSIETGHERDYSEGAAYRDYFASDRLMFEVSVRDGRLRNKDEVLVLRSEFIAGQPPVAIAVDRLKRNSAFTFTAGERTFVVVTTVAGANLMYESGGHTFDPRLVDRQLRDSKGRTWTVTDDALAGDAGERLRRVPAHRAFWFGWVAQHPTTTLIRD